jgi:tRNA modification GTPase
MAYACDTIAAVATPPATGAVGIIRLSGPAAFDIADAVFTPNGGTPLSELPKRYAHLGKIKDFDGRVIDSALALLFPAPNSYTGEDCAEFHCHGGLALLNRVLSLCFANGARAAQRGEFTKRAFLNGKLDLSGAEAVADLIAAENVEGIKNAAGQLTGRLHSGLEEISNTLLDVLSHFTAYIDYTDEGVEPPDLGATVHTLEDCAKKLRALSDSFSEGRLFTEGVRCAIIGKPNAGKSSILNALVGYDRSIVTEFAGTTRDTIEETVRLDSVILRLVDTAGLRTAKDLAEKLGVERAVSAADSAGLIIAVFDGSVPASAEDEQTLSVAQESECEKIYVINKCDLDKKLKPEGLIPGRAVEISAKTGEGLDKLKEEIKSRFVSGKIMPDGSIITNRRQADAMRRAAEHAERAANTLRANLTPDVAWVDAESALCAVGEVTGKTVSFSK